jgi:Protein of unknown function (DUF1360)
VVELALVWTQLLLMAATAWRLTHLITADQFPPIRWGRERLSAHAPEWIGDLVTCAYCAGVWVAALIVGAAELVGPVPRPWFQFGFVAAAIPVIEAIVGRLEREPTMPPLPPPPPTTYQRSGRVEPYG